MKTPQIVSKYSNVSYIMHEYYKQYEKAYIIGLKSHRQAEDISGDVQDYKELSRHNLILLLLIAKSIYPTLIDNDALKECLRCSGYKWENYSEDFKFRITSGVTPRQTKKECFVNFTKIEDTEILNINCCELSISQGVIHEEIYNLAIYDDELLPILRQY
jgi:hypothetical protein